MHLTLDVISVISDHKKSISKKKLVLGWKLQYLNCKAPVSAMPLNACNIACALECILRLAANTPCKLKRGTQQPVMPSCW